MVSLNGKMVDSPVIERARLVLERAALSGLREEPAQHGRKHDEPPTTIDDLRQPGICRAIRTCPKPTCRRANRAISSCATPCRKRCAAAGLQDGMTISFHHAFRGGDLTLNQVMETLAAMGFRNLTLASSSLTDCHAPLVEHIRHGVVSRIYTSGLRGPLADAVSRGLLAEPVQIHSHGGRVNLIESAS